MRMHGMRIADYLEYYQAKEWVIQKRFHSWEELAWELTRESEESKEYCGLMYFVKRTLFLLIPFFQINRFQNDSVHSRIVFRSFRNWNVTQKLLLFRVFSFWNSAKRMHPKVYIQEMGTFSKFNTFYRVYMAGEKGEPWTMMPWNQNWAKERPALQQLFPYKSS